MAARITSQTSSTTARGSIAARTYGATFGALRAWSDARQTRNALCALSLHELHDIGYGRCDIERAARR